jgi:hypothetical protein
MMSGNIFALTSGGRSQHPKPGAKLHRQLMEASGCVTCVSELKDRLNGILAYRREEPDFIVWRVHAVILHLSSSSYIIV